MKAVNPIFFIKIQSFRLPLLHEKDGYLSGLF